MKQLQLHFSQLSKIWNRSKNNHYSDNSRQSYHLRLKELYEKISAEDFSIISDQNQINEKKTVMRFFSDSITFLDNSTVSSLPFELVKCLEIALKEWSGGEDFIIVTSLAKGLNEFSFDPSLATNDFQYEVLRSNYSIEFEKRLIQINIPQYLVGDYLANVIMYHELGHFIEGLYSLPDIILREFLDDYNSKKIGADFHVYFPFVRKRFSADKIYNDECIDMLRLHIGEYFCDLFASQYVSDSVNHYLSYISENDNLTKTHPPTQRRLKLVTTFLNKKKSYTLDKILDIVKRTTQQDIRIRYEEFKSNDFLNLLPVDIKTDSQLHYLFIHGWQLWLGNWKEFETRNKMKYKLKGAVVYGIINDLIEKSIGNFIVKNIWNDVSSQTAGKK